jgi:hypothetical protein
MATETTPSSPLAVDLPGLLELPMELRFQLYDLLISVQHTIVIAPKSKKRGILRPLSQACKKTRGEIEEWLKGNSRLVASPVLGIFDNKLTTFEMSWVDKFEAKPQMMLGLQYQRYYTPGAMSRTTDLKAMECYQKAMDLSGSNQQSKVNNELIRLGQMYTDMTEEFNCPLTKEWGGRDTEVAIIIFSDPPDNRFSDII